MGEPGLNSAPVGTPAPVPGAPPREAPPATGVPVVTPPPVTPPPVQVTPTPTPPPPPTATQLQPRLGAVGRRRPILVGAAGRARDRQGREPPPHPGLDVLDGSRALLAARVGLPRGARPQDHRVADVLDGAHGILLGRPAAVAQPLRVKRQLPQYDVGKTARELADARRYEVEVRWANGQATDDEYLAVLREAIAVADPDSIEKISAQNKLDDAVFRIGRSRAEATGDPEALIAFDQAALASMNPGSLRYRDLQQTLNTELADRRSRQYGDLVEQYNAGRTTTEALLNWINGTLASLPAGAPDRDNWEEAKRDLGERVQNEKDTQAFQDYQMERITDEQYLAYLSGRRGQYIIGSPQYAELHPPARGRQPRRSRRTSSTTRTTCSSWAPRPTRSSTATPGAASPTRSTSTTSASASPRWTPTIPTGTSGAPA